MKHLAAWTLVLVLIWQNFAYAKSQVSSQNIKELRRDYSTQEANCKKENCDDLKLLEITNDALEELQEMYDKAALLEQTNATLRAQAKTLKKSQPIKISRKNKCEKKEILKSKLQELGINENGSIIYDKRPVDGANAKCWSNSRKKKDATVVLCEFPLAVNILTKGGPSDQIVETGIQYMFDLNGCDLIAVKKTQENSKFKLENDLSLKTCVEQWNKRGSDALMTKAQIETMETTIQECFKYSLLPANNAVIQKINNKPEQKSKTQSPRLQ